MRRRSIVVTAVSALGLLLVVAIGAALFAVATPSGSAWLVSTLAAQMAQTITLEDFQGKLIKRFSIGRLELAVGETTVSVSDLDFAWRASSLLKTRLVIEKLSVRQLVVNTTPTDEPQSGPVELTLPNLPLALDIRQASVGELDLLVGDSKHQLKNIELAIEWANDRVEIKQLAANMGEQQAALIGTVENRVPLELSARIDWSGVIDAVPSTVLLNLTGPLDALTLDAKTSGFIVTKVNGKADLSDRDLPFSVSLEHGEKRITAESPMRVIAGTLGASGSTKTIVFQYNMHGATNTDEVLSIKIDGQLTGLDSMNDGVDGVIDWQINHPLFLESGLNGHTALAFKNDRLDVESSTRAPFTSRFSASLNPLDLDQKASASISWNDFLVPGIPGDDLIGQQGTFKLNGTPSVATLALESVWSHREYGPVSIATQGVLKEQQLTLSNGLAKLLNGSIDYTGVIDWHQVPTVDFKIDGTGLDVSKVRADLDALIDVAAEVNLKVPESGPQTSITLKRVAGTWLGQDLIATGKLNIDPNARVVENLQAAIGANRVAIDLTWSDRLTGGYEINAPNLSGIDPNLRGRLSGDGRFTGTPEAPELEGNLTGKGLQFYSWVLNALDLNYDLSPFSAKSSYVKGELNGLRQKGSKKFTADATLDAEGSAENHIVTLSVDTDALQLAAKLSGRWADDSWQGGLHTLSIKEDTFGDWSLREKAGLLVRKTGDFRLLDKLCVGQTGAGLCLNSAQRDGDRTKIGGILNALPVALLNPWLPSGMEARGDFSAQFAIDGDAKSFTGTGNYQIDAGMITATLEDEAPREIAIENFSGWFDADADFAKLGLTTQIGDWLDLKVDAKVPTAPAAALEANITGVSENIAWLGEFVPDLAGSNGRVEISGKILGQRDNPEIDVAAGLKSGTLTLPASGLRFSAFDIALKSAQANVLAVNVQAKPQKGEVRLAGRLTTLAEKNWPFEFSLDGDAFSGARLPDLEMDIAPSLNVIGNSKKVAVTGNVQIPYFSYTLNEMPKSAVRVSGDTVIIGVDDIEQQPRDAAADWFEKSVFLDVDVQLGDEVSVAGLGMFATLAGGIEVTKGLGDEIKGTGTVLIASGNFDAYGQSLSIKNGRMMFAGPITNPTLNIRAMRDNIPIIAGIAITGSARAPKFDVFSEPALPDAEALSYVVIGRPLGEGSNADAALISRAALGFGLDQSAVITNQLRDLFALDELGLSTSGDIDQTALIAGKQITPKVSIRTEMNIFDTLWSFFLRYKLTEKWSIEAESGERQGADIIYNVESESILDFNPFK